MMKRKIIILCLLALPWYGLRANEVEQHFRQVKTEFHHRQRDAQKDLKQYLVDYPYTTYYSETNLMIGVLQVEKEKYKQALKTFAKVEAKELERDQQPMLLFYKGYALMQEGQTASAVACFKVLKSTQSPYTLQGKYYYAYCSYREGHYDKALPEFLSIEHTAQYKYIVPYYLVQIYYAQHNYDEVYDRAAFLLRENPDSEYTGEIHRIMGELYYEQGRYIAAVEHLTAYEEDYRKQKKPLVRNDIYLLGIAQYQLEHWTEATTYLKQVKQIHDTLSESTCLHLGHAYIHMGDIERAKLSYGAAIRFNLNSKVREEAMYNYALASYQSGTALGENISAFEEFLTAYPNTHHAEEVYQLLADMYVSSKNYMMALGSIDKIKNPTPKLLNTKQYLRFQMGADYFVQGKMLQTIEWMQRVVDNERGTSAYKTEAYYYLAEAKYRLHEYEDCYRFIRLYQSQSNVQQSANKEAVYYLKGYTLFSMKQYGESENVFRQYLGLGISPHAPTYLDAENRIGDCCFNNRAFQDAADMYQRVIDEGKTGADYAMFQRGYVQGLMHHYTEKAKVMEQLVRRYPRSDYADDALYEIARAQLQDDRNTAAIDAYNRLIEQYPNSNYSRKAALEVGMIYRNQKQYTEAIVAFKHTIERYPGSEEAYAALDGLEQVYVETNKISDYIAYTRGLGKMNMSISTQEDSLMYVTAELQYMLGNYKAAAAGLTTYLSQYCQGGRYCTMATYYAADCYYRLNEKDAAMQQYRVLCELPGNPYMEEACMRMAELAFDAQDYTTARTYFDRMLSLSPQKANRTAAMLGILRCSYFLHDRLRIMEIASTILDDDTQSESVRSEAMYNRGKVYIEAENYGQAVVDLMPLSRDVRIETGAEAKYLLAYCYYRLGAIDSAEGEIMDFATHQTQHQYWLAKSLILLSDINLQRGDTFQARQYLLTLQTNYHAQDDIQQLVEQHLRVLDQQESTTTDNTNTQDDNDED